MTYRKCDRCGKDLPIRYSENDAPSTMKIKYDGSDLCYWRTFDLCHECTDILAKFLKKWEIDEED